MPIDQNGLVEVDSAKTAASALDDAELIIQPEPPQSSFAGLIDGVFRAQDEAMVVVIDCTGRKVYTRDNANKAALITALGTTSPAPDGSHVVKPEAGQTGRSLKWETEGTPTHDQAAIINAIIGNQTPKMTVGALVARCLAVLSDGFKWFVTINQATGEVYLFYVYNEDGDTASDALEAVAVPANTNTFDFLLTDEEGATTSEPLVFEGGET